MKSSLGLIVLVGMLAVVSASAQSSAQFTITRGVIAGGGATFSASGRFQLGSTIAQPFATVASSARFSVKGGFWIWTSPVLFAPARVGDDFIVSIQTELGKIYALQYMDSLSMPVWQILPGVIGNGAVETVTNSAPGVPQRFYRLDEQ
ncbi:MAG: hypothetical protein ABSH48_21450 [Verrucomicrobiota bacterium]|jgi:hypothetical protein